MIKYDQFYRQFMIRRVVDLDRVIDLDTMPELPRGAIVHCLDNLYRSSEDLLLTPNDKNIFLQKEPPLKYYHAIRAFEPSPSDVIAPNDTGIKPKTMGMLMSQLASFRQEHNRTWKQCASIQAIPDRADVMGVVSYNTLFNVRISGMYPQIRFMNYILACLVNSLARVRNIKRPHIVHFPILPRMYDRQLFIKALEQSKYDKGRDALLDQFAKQNYEAADEDKKGEITEKIERSVIRLPNDPFYLLLLHWLCFVDGKSTYSIFEYIPKEMLPYVVFAFTSGNKALFYSLPDMLKLNGKNNAIIIRLIRQMNSLAMSDENTELTKVIEAPEHITSAPKEEKVVDKDSVENEDAAKLSTDLPDPEEVESLPKEFRIADIDFDLDDVFNTQPVDPKYVTVNPEEGKINAPSYDGETNTDELQTFIQNAAKEIEELSSKSIREDTRLTPLQKQRMEQIAQEWKDVKLNDVPLKDLVAGTTATVKTSENTVDLKGIKEYGGDSSMEKSTISSFDEDYLKHSFDKDLASVLVSVAKNGMYLTDIRTEKVVNQMNRETRYNVTYTDNTRKKHHIKFTIPEIDEYGLCWINGSEKRLRKQRVSLPICKVSPTRVTLNSNFNKTLVERNTTVAHSFYPYFLKITSKAPGKKVVLDYGLVDLQGRVLPYEYTQLAKHHPHMTIEDVEFSFDFDNRMEIAHNSFKDDVDALRELEKEYGVLFGIDKNANVNYFMKLDGSVNIVDCESKSLVEQGNFIDIMCKLLDVSMSPLQEYVEMKILDKQIPVGFILCYRFGLLHMLKYLKTDYKIYQKGVRKQVSSSDVILDFADCSIVIKRVPYVNSLIFAGLNFFKLKDVTFAEMNDKNIYYDLLAAKGFSLNYIKGIDTHFDFFIDPITADVLTQMKEPTNFKDLIIRATALLSTEEHMNPSSSSNFRFRGYEMIPAIVYNEVARGLDRYRNKSLGATNVFSINAEAVKQRFLQDQLVSNTDGLNPLQDLRERTMFSHTGFGGRDMETFMINDRKFTDDARGIVSEATVAGSTVAVVSGMSMDPTISNTRGMTVSKGVGELSPTEMLSATALVLPGITQDDGKRAYLAGLQIAQYMPTHEGEVSPIRTGYERVLAQRSRPPYAYPAKMDGRILEIDENVHLMKIEYVDGTLDVVPFGDQLSRNSSSGFYNTNRMVINDFKVGDKFKAQDILSYNKDCFQADPYSKQVDWKIGVLANVVLVECDDTLDDCSAITAELASKLGVTPVHPFTVMLSKDTVVHSCKKLGDHVEIREPMITYDKSEVPESLRSSDAAVLEVLAKINKTSEKAHHAGSICKIEAYYTCPVSEMSESLQSIVKTCVKTQNAMNRFANGTVRQDKFVESGTITTDYRVDGIVPEEDSVILKFYISEDVDMDAGSKIVYSTELKSVVGYIIPQQLDTESGDCKVDALMSMRAANARIVYSPFVTGACNRVLEKLQEDVIKMFDE